VINRGDARMAVHHKDGDNTTLLEMLCRAQEDTRARLLG